MTARRAFRIGGWVALVAGMLTAAVAATVAVVGVLALSGRVTYPVDIGIGPLSLRSTVSMPVALGADVCRTADVAAQEPRDCFRFFLHEEDGSWGEERIRRQDADVRPTVVTLRGDVELATTTGGWSPLVAASTVRGTIGLVVLSGLLLLLWRLLAAAAAGEAFSRRGVRQLRGIGSLVIAGAVLEPALMHFTSASQLGYSVEVFGVAPQLTPLGSAGYPGGVDLARLALGGLVLLLAEVFRHGAAIESERRLTV